jgi:polar amino acid transport system substrate-binding protein
LRRAILTAVVVAGLVVAAVGPAGAQATPLRVAAEVPQPQFWNGTAPAAATGGFEYDLAKALAARLGYSGVQVVAVPFDQLLAGKAKGYDIGLEQALIPRTKKAKVAFSSAYLDFDLGILVRPGTAVPDARAARALRWGVWTGPSSAGTFLTKVLDVTNPPQVYPDLAQAVTALQANQVDAVLDYSVSVLRQATTSGGRLTVVGQFRTGEQIGAVLPKGSKLTGRVNQAIQALRADGTIGRLAAQHLGGDPTAVPFLAV